MEELLGQTRLSSLSTGQPPTLAVYPASGCDCLWLQLSFRQQLPANICY